MILHARRRPQLLKGLRQALPSACFYLALVTLFVFALPEKAWQIRPQHLIVVGILGLWRYCWMALHMARAAIYSLFWFPKVRRRAENLPPDLSYPERLYLLIPTYREIPWVSQSMMHSVLREVSSLRCKTTLLVSCAEGEDVLFQKVLEHHPRGDQVELVLLNQKHGKRVGMGQALRALCRQNKEEDSLVVFMDGDTVLGPDTFQKCLPLFKLFPRLGAVTTDELPVVDGSRAYKDWYELRFAQRHRLMKSMSLSRRVLTLTGRFSIFRTSLAVDEEFISYLEKDRLDHWLHGRFRFLTGDDKSTWFKLLKGGWEMLYVPDAVVFCLESADENPLRQSVAKMTRWFGNMLRNNGRAIALGPKPMGFFVWWCLVDQRLSMWTTLVGPAGAIFLALFESPYYLAFYVIGAVAARLFYLTVLALEGLRSSLIHLPQLLYTQWAGSFVKIWVLFRLDRQTWGAARGGMRLQARGGAPLWLKRVVPGMQTALAAVTFLGVVAVLVGVLRVPSEPFELMAGAATHKISVSPGTVTKADTVYASDFGARGDDAEADDRAIQQALDSLTGTERGVVVLPRGRLLLEGPLRIGRSHTWLVGAGASETVLEASFTRDMGEAAILVAGAGRRRSAGSTLAAPLGAEQRVAELSAPLAVDRAGFLWLGTENSPDFMRALGARNWNRPFPWLRQALTPVTGTSGEHVLLANELGFALPAQSRAEPAEMVRNVRLEGFAMRHTVPGADREKTRFLYDNLYPDHAVDAIAFQWAAYSEAADLRIEMSGRHPVNIENSYGVSLKNLDIDGAWNKGEDGMGYLRFARSYYCSLESSRIRNIRHLVFQWSAAYNEVRRCTIEVDVNFHGGFSHHNVVRDSKLSPPEQHPWPAVFETPNTASWAPPDGDANKVIELP